MKATVVETYQWAKAARMRGLVIDTDEGRIPGMFTVDLNDVDGSINLALANWRDYTQIHYKDVSYPVDPSINNGKPYFQGTYVSTSYNRAFTFNTQDAKQAIKDALQGHV